MAAVIKIDRMAFSLRWIYILDRSITSGEEKARNVTKRDFFTKEALGWLGERINACERDESDIWFRRMGNQLSTTISQEQNLEGRLSGDLEHT